ncbi:MAG TPA: hypothetical protein VHS76_17090 [Steroidobacteraceae bacterium]|nr:hypothetical protein [Steroidobacteraceae bacterium]
MNAALRVVVYTLLAITAVAAHAERNSIQRVAAFGKLPDWSGVWERFNIGPSDAPSDPKEIAQYEAAYRELRLPYNAEWQSKHDATVQHRKQSHQAPQARCRPLGFPQAMIFPSDMIQFIVVPEETTLLFYSGGARHIATDGRGHPPADERWLTPWGDSVGHWEGEVLVVDTVASNAPIMSYDGPAVLSEQAHVIERIRALDTNTLENQMTISDTVALANPWVLTLRYHRVPGMAHILDSDCAENERNPVVEGKYTIAPPKN